MKILYRKERNKSFPLMFISQKQENKENVRFLLF